MECPKYLPLKRTGRAASTSPDGGGLGVRWGDRIRLHPIRPSTLDLGEAYHLLRLEVFQLSLDLESQTQLQSVETSKQIQTQTPSHSFTIVDHTGSLAEVLRKTP